MATISPTSSPSAHDEEIPTATLALPSIAAASSSRRLPPPCWSPEETVALIDAYREKWYSLRRGNLRANHWQEVADAVASRCPINQPKTAVQCRHKMEKLRKRYRGEIQRSAGVRRFNSSWAHFQNMHDMEKGPNAKPSPPSSSDDDGDELPNNRKNGNDFYNHNSNNNQKGGSWNQGPVSNGVRIKIPGRVASVPAAPKVYSKLDDLVGGQNFNNPYPRFAANSYGAGSSKVFKDRFAGRGEMGNRLSEVKRKNEDSGGIGEVAASIQALGESFMRIEKVKMDMARQVEEMRMEMELKRTEMILESQQRIVEAFANAISERADKKAKKMSTSPS